MDGDRDADVLVTVVFLVGMACIGVLADYWTYQRNRSLALWGTREPTLFDWGKWEWECKKR